MADHHELNLGGDRRLEWNKGVGGAVAGKVLDGGVYPGRVHAGDRGRHVLRDDTRILPVAPLAHEWVDAIPDVGHRGQIDIETERLQSPRHRRHLGPNRGWPLRAGLSGPGQTGDASLEKTD